MLIPSNAVFLTVLDVVKSCDMFWHFFCTILCLDHFVRSKWWGDECKSLASRRLRSSMVSGGRPPMHTGAILGKTCSLNWLLWADYSCLNCLKLINKWSQFDESLNHLESFMVCLAGGKLWFQLQTLCCTTSPCALALWCFMQIDSIHFINISQHGTMPGTTCLFACCLLWKSMTFLLPSLTRAPGRRRSNDC